MLAVGVDRGYSCHRWLWNDRHRKIKQTMEFNHLYKCCDVQAMNLWTPGKRQWGNPTGLTVQHKEYSHGWYCGGSHCRWILTQVPISLRHISLLQTDDCPSNSEAKLNNLVKQITWSTVESWYNINTPACILYIPYYPLGLLAVSCRYLAPR